MQKNFSTLSSLPSHSIVALATPRFKSALALIRITGDDCLNLFSPFIKKSAKKLPIDAWLPNTSTHCLLHNPSTKELLDQALVQLYRAPKTYTGQDLIELSIHGGLVGIDKLLSALESNGFEQARPGEFTLRAYLNAKLDLTQVEAIEAIINATNTHSHSLALEQLAGSISQYIDEIKAELKKLAAICSVSLDYPDDEIQESTLIDPQLVQSLIDKLARAIKNFDLSKVHRDGASIIIAGRTNAGKSELFNALLKENRAIVSELHGTTRDYLESPSLLKNIPLRLFDTAGLRSTSDSVELEGIERTSKLIKNADLVLYVVDSSQEIQEEDSQILKRILEDRNSSSVLIIWNKIDLTPNRPVPATYMDIDILALSAQRYIDIDKLQDYLYSKLTQHNNLLTEDLSVIANLRQRQHLNECLEALKHVLEGLEDNIPLDMISLDLGSALRALGAITGEVSNEEILDLMFSTFCLGK